MYAPRYLPSWLHGSPHESKTALLVRQPNWLWNKGVRLVVAPVNDVAPYGKAGDFLVRLKFEPIVSAPEAPAFIPGHLIIEPLLTNERHGPLYGIVVGNRTRFLAIKDAATQMSDLLVHNEAYHDQLYLETIQADATHLPKLFPDKKRARQDKPLESPTERQRSDSESSEDTVLSSAETVAPEPPVTAAQEVNDTEDDGEAIDFNAPPTPSEVGSTPSQGLTHQLAGMVLY